MMFNCDINMCLKILLIKLEQEFTEHVEFQREMNALLQIRAHGGHPNICMLRENFDEEDDYLLVLDLVLGKEMFDHLIEHGAYSEADASRLVRQVASALDFIHGIGVVHADLKVCFILPSVSSLEYNSMCSCSIFLDVTAREHHAEIHKR